MEAFKSPLFWIILFIAVVFCWALYTSTKRKPGHYGSTKKYTKEDEDSLIGKRKGGTYL
jgi:hypothetical protein